MVDTGSISPNQLFDTLAEWEHVLKHLFAPKNEED